MLLISHLKLLMMRTASSSKEQQLMARLITTTAALLLFRCLLQAHRLPGRIPKCNWLRMQPAPGTSIRSRH